MMRRPKAGDTEEDLLRMQEEFLAKEGASSAASLTSKGDKRKNVAADADVGHRQGLKIEKDVVQLAGTGTVILCLISRTTVINAACVNHRIPF